MNPFAIFDVIAKLLGIGQQKDEQLNAPDVKEAKKAANEAAEVDRERRIVEEEDTDEVRKGLS